MSAFVAGVLLLLGPLVMGPFVMGPFVMGPFVMGLLVMGPYVRRCTELMPLLDDASNDNVIHCLYVISCGFTVS
jgi:hypothetical protein